jgi:hypothetical protein
MSEAERELEREIARLTQAGGATGRARMAHDDVASMSAPAFRFVVAERLRGLERDLAEVRARVNGLLFVVAGAVVAQLLLRLLG